MPRQSAPRPHRNDAPDTSAPHEAQASVTLQRETATFTVPVSEAVMPSSLRAALATTESRLSALEPRLVVAAIEPETAPEEGGLGQAGQHREEDPLSDDDRALIRRIAPPAAE
jgi:hypothetical protein